METVGILYAEIFSIRFLHDGFNTARRSPISDNISIIPDTDTSRLFQNLGIGYVFTDDRFVCWIRSKRVAPPASQPRVPLIENKDDIKLRFLLTTNGNFHSKTDVIHSGSKEVYYFSNRANNIDPAPPSQVLLHKNPFVDNPDLVSVSSVNTGQKCFGVIDIHNSGTANGYELFNASGHLLSPAYAIRLKSKI